MLPSSSAPQAKTKPFTLYPKQRAFRESSATIRGFVGGRGAGKSKVGAYDMLRRLEPGGLYMLVSPTYKMLKDASAREMMNIGREFGRLIKTNWSDQYAIFRTDKGGSAHVSFRTAEIPDNLRGPNLRGAWLDEASYMRDEAFDIILGSLRDNAQLGWISATFTPKGKNNWTYRVFKGDILPSVELFHATTSDNPFSPPEFYSLLKTRYGENKSRQELEGQFVDNEGQLIPYEDLISCTVDGCDWGAGCAAKCGPLYVGWDVGRSKHKSVMWTWERVGDVAWCRECAVFSNTSYEIQEHEFTRRMKHPSTVRGYMDAGMVGSIAERMERQFGKHKFNGVHLNGFTQGHLAEQLQLAFERKSVRIPDNSDIRDDFSLVDKPENKNGRACMPAVNVHEDAELGHADRFWAAALAYDALANHRPTGSIAVPISRPSSLTGATRGYR